MDSFCKNLETLQYNLSKKCPHNAEKGYAVVIVTVMLAFLMSCGTVPSLKHQKRISSSFMMRVPLVHLKTSGGMLYFPGTLPVATASSALPSLQGWFVSSYSKVGRYSMAFKAASLTTFSLVYSSELCSIKHS